MHTYIHIYACMNRSLSYLLFTCIHIHTHILVYIHTHTVSHTHTYTCSRDIYTHAFVRTCKQIFFISYICTHTHALTHMYAYIRTHTHTCMHIRIYMHTHTHTLTHALDIHIHTSICVRDEIIIVSCIHMYAHTHIHMQTHTHTNTLTHASNRNIHTYSYVHVNRSLSNFSACLVVGSDICGV